MNCQADKLQSLVLSWRQNAVKAEAFAKAYGQSRQWVDEAMQRMVADKYRECADQLSEALSTSETTSNTQGE